jgi:hypothetical protein
VLALLYLSAWTLNLARSNPWSQSYDGELQHHLQRNKEHSAFFEKKYYPLKNALAYYNASIVVVNWKS